MAAPLFFWFRPACLPVGEACVAIVRQWRRRWRRWRRRWRRWRVSRVGPWWGGRRATPARMLAAPSLFADGPPGVPVRVSCIAVVWQFGSEPSCACRTRGEQEDDHHDDKTQKPDATANEEAGVVDLFARHHVELPGAKSYEFVVRLLGVVATTPTNICHDWRA